MDTKKIVCKLMIIMVLLLTIVNNLNADAQAADNRLFHNPGLGFDNTLSGGAIPSEQMIVYVDFNVLKGKDGYVQICCSKSLVKAFRLSKHEWRNEVSLIVFGVVRPKMVRLAMWCLLLVIKLCLEGLNI